MSARLAAVVASLMLWMPAAPAQADKPDQIQLLKHSGEWGALVPKENTKTEYGFRAYRSTADTLQVGTIPNGVNNQAIVFRRRNPPTFAIDVWTDGADDVLTELQAEIPVPITFWIVNGDPEDQLIRMIYSFFNAAYIWREERTGLRPVWWNLIDRTTESESGAATPSIDFTTCDDRIELQAFGFEEGVVNVYVVDRVYGSRSRATVCGSPRDFIALGSQANLTVLAHELTHLLRVSHPSATSPHFDGTNLMSPTSNSRYYLTEGQIVRAHLDSYSVVNDVLAARPAALTRDCLLNSLCPVKHKRVWSDGPSWPPN